MSWYAYGITAAGERVPLSVEAATDPTGLVIPSVHLNGQAFARVEVHPMPEAPKVEYSTLEPFEIGVLSGKRGGKVAEMQRLARELDASTTKPARCARCDAPVTISTEPAAQQIADEHDDPETGAICRGGGVQW